VKLPVEGTGQGNRTGIRELLSPPTKKEALPRQPPQFPVQTKRERNSSQYEGHETNQQSKLGGRVKDNWKDATGWTEGGGRPGLWARFKEGGKREEEGHMAVVWTSVHGIGANGGKTAYWLRVSRKKEEKSSPSKGLWSSNIGVCCGGQKGGGVNFKCVKVLNCARAEGRGNSTRKNRRSQRRWKS